MGSSCISSLIFSKLYALFIIFLMTSLPSAMSSGCASKWIFLWLMITLGSFLWGSFSLVIIVRRWRCAINIRFMLLLIWWLMLGFVSRPSNILIVYFQSFIFMEPLSMSV